MTDDKERPVTLYVESINTNPKLPTASNHRTSNLDIELSNQAAEELANFLSFRISTADGGAIRVRLTGRLVIH